MSTALDIRHVSGAAHPPGGAYDADIIILALGRADETIAAIASALEQGGCSRHVFILDQGSPPATLARFAAAVHGRDDATLLGVSTNLGVPGGRNLLSQRGHAGAIVSLDNDAVFADAGTVARALAAFAREPGLGAIGFRIVEFASGRDDLSSWGYPAGLLARAGETFDAATFVGAGHAIRRAAWLAAGGYDAALFFCWEEFDFSLRAIAAGWRIAYHGAIAVRHRVSSEARVVWSEARWFYSVRNRLYIGRKYGAGWLALTPRIAAYTLRGLRNGLLWQTLRALPAARRLALDHPARILPAETRRYLRANDAAHRGGILTRLRNEVLGRFTDPASRIRRHTLTRIG